MERRFAAKHFQKMIVEKFTLTKLKKQLSQKTKKELIAEISRLCKKFAQVREYYQFQSSDFQNILEKYRNIIEKEFIEGKTRVLPKARIPVARKAIRDFKKLTDDSELLADLMLTFTECVSRFSTEFGVDAEEFYSAPENMFEEALKLLAKNNLLSLFEERAYEIVDHACDAWGHFDSLKLIYEEFYGEFIE